MCDHPQAGILAVGTRSCNFLEASRELWQGSQSLIVQRLVKLEMERGYDHANQLLGEAVLAGNASKVGELLDLGLDANQAFGNKTLLQHSFILGHTQIFDMLIDSGADPLSRDLNGEDFFTWQAKQPASPLRRLLVERALLSPHVASIDRRGR